MTLSTLKTMNVQMGDLARVVEAQAAATRGVRAGSRRRKAPAPRSRRRPQRSVAGGVVDPMQWWGALTNQFAQLATTAMKDSAADAAKTLAGNMLKQSFDSAAAGFKAVGQRAGEGGHRPPARPRSVPPPAPARRWRGRRRRKKRRPAAKT